MLHTMFANESSVQGLSRYPEHIIIIIIINCNWVITRWQWLYYMYTNMERKKVARKFKSGVLHERHVVATWKLITLIIPATMRFLNFMQRNAYKFFVAKRSAHNTAHSTHSLAHNTARSTHTTA